MYGLMGRLVWRVSGLLLGLGVRLIRRGSRLIVLMLGCLIECRRRLVMCGVLLLRYWVRLVGLW